MTPDHDSGSIALQVDALALLLPSETEQLLNQTNFIRGLLPDSDFFGQIVAYPWAKSREIRKA